MNALPPRAPSGIQDKIVEAFDDWFVSAYGYRPESEDFENHYRTFGAGFLAGLNNAREASESEGRRRAA